MEVKNVFPEANFAADKNAMLLLSTRLPSGLSFFQNNMFNFSNNLLEN